MKKKIFVFIMTLIVLLGIIGSSYAYLKAERGSGDNTISLSNFGVILLQDMTSIEMDNYYPVEDSVGLKNQSTTFQIKNTGSIIAKYKVSLVDGETKSTMLNDSVRYKLTRTSSVDNITETFDITNLSLDGLLDEGTIEVDEVITYNLVMWIDYDSNPNNLTFSKVVEVKGMQISNLDESGANYPELLDNMIPVYYDATSDTEGVWRVADLKNLNKDYKWFDYNDFMWANAVTVNKDAMDNYYGYNGPETTSDLSVNIETNEEITETKSITTYTSGNKKVNSSASNATFNFTTSSAGVLTFDYSVSSEANYDKLTITINNGSSTTTLVNAISGTNSGSSEYDLSANTSYTLIVSYTKDGSSESGNDQATISNILITSSLSSELTYTEDATYPYTTTTADKTFTTPENKQLASTSYTYDEETGKFTLIDASSIVYTSSSMNYYTCNSNTKIECFKLYEITEIDSKNVVTKVKVHYGSNKGTLGSVLGQEVSMDDITTMWVWIPRYKYTIWAGNNETSEEQLINIEFEHGTESTGTVKCDDNILSSSSSSSSETCTDKTNGSIINGVSTYTHPAFTFGREELTGIWYAKFEMSTDQDSTCVTNPSTSNCDTTGQNIYVKPDQVSLRYINNANMFVNIRNMELYSNVHGFSQSSSATNSSSQAGVIENDNNNYDIHMQKNMEWGAATYLAYSKYGKYGNSLYEGIYKRVYKNNYYTSTNYTFKTGYSGYSYNENPSTSSTTLYNNLTNLGSGKGYKGAGASTTGTIYGVYDMNGGGYDRVMGNMVNSSGNFYSSSSGFSLTPLTKYYDKYSYSSSFSNSQDYVSRGKLGDATKEMTKNFTSVNSASWEGNIRYLPYSSYSWFSRGGLASGSAYYGVSYSNSNSGYGNTGTSRPVLVVAR